MSYVPLNLQTMKAKHMAELGQSVRKADQTEIEAFLGDTVLEAIWQSERVSRYTWAVTEDDTQAVVCIFGIADFGGPELGVPWMMGSDLVEKHWLACAKFTGTIIQAMLLEFKELACISHFGNSLHHHWLVWAGFKFVRYHSEFGAGRVPAYEFRIKRGDITNV